MSLVSETSAKTGDRTGDAVPVIDISGYFSGSAADKRRVVQQTGEACRTIGFLVVTGHGVPDELIRRTEATGRAFFDLPDAEKRRFGTPDPNIYRGYYAVETNAVAYSRDDRVAPPDYRELFSINRVTTDPSDPTIPRPWAGAFSRPTFGRKESPDCVKPGPNTTSPWRNSRKA
jgi:isopenicillin N synthase-like dioxygenase